MEVAEDVARDGAGNGNRAAEPLVIEADLEWNGGVRSDDHLLGAGGGL